MEMTIKEQVVRTVTITLKGRVDSHSVRDFIQEQDALVQRGASHFIVDIREVDFIDSLGIASLVSLQQKAGKAGAKVVIVRPESDNVWETLRLARFDKVFTFVRSRAEAPLN